MGESAGAVEPGIVLGFDFGTRRIGVALGNGITRSAHGLKVVHCQAQAYWGELAELIREWQPSQLVVGVARHPDGAAHEMTQRCERFARQLEGRFRLPVARVDERYSSAVLPAIDSRAPDPAQWRAEPRDDEAAALILQQWFDENRAAPRGWAC